MWNQGQVIPSRVCDGTDLTKPFGLLSPEGNEGRGRIDLCSTCALMDGMTHDVFLPDVSSQR